MARPTLYEEKKQKKSFTLTPSAHAWILKNGGSDFLEKISRSGLVDNRVLKMHEYECEFTDDV